jgi:zinc D-Ala-D-Ala dipeptidase
MVLVLALQFPIPANSTNTQFADVRGVNSAIALDMRYATRNNFTKMTLYRQPRCFLREPVARRLAQVQTDLQSQGLGLKVFDCYRPFSVQKLMWKIVPDERYVANPAKGSRHNRGAAVDLTLVDRTGKALEMPSDFDDFSDRASRTYAKATQRARENSQRLEAVMKKYGFSSLPTEWWHFDGQGWEQYPISDIAFEAIR